MACARSLLIGALYVFYCVTRTFADGDLGPAQDRAGDLLHLERVLHLDWEHPINNWFVAHAWARDPGLLLVRRGPLRRDRCSCWSGCSARAAAHYTPARWALVVSCLIALACYLLLPTAPPRMLSGYTDVLSLHAADGWWGTDASAPKGMGQLTNELAAFPSLHAGWALWVALVVRRSHPQLLGCAAWPGCTPLITAIVVIGTGNHWILDVAVGWAVVIVAMWLVDPWFARPASAGRAAPDRVPQARSPAPRGRRRDDPGLDARRSRSPARPLDEFAEPPRQRRYDCDAAAAGRPAASGCASRASAWRTRSPSYVVHIGGRLASQEAAVAGRGQPRVEHRDDAAVGGGADQPAGALGEQQRGVGGGDLHEAVAARPVGGPLPGAHQRVVGPRERDPVDEHQLAGVARDVEALPQAERAEQAGVRVARRTAGPARAAGRRPGPAWSGAAAARGPPRPRSRRPARLENSPSVRPSAASTSVDDLVELGLRRARRGRAAAGGGRRRGSPAGRSRTASRRRGRARAGRRRRRRRAPRGHRW